MRDDILFHWTDLYVIEERMTLYEVKSDKRVAVQGSY